MYGKAILGLMFAALLMSGLTDQALALDFGKIKPKVNENKGKQQQTTAVSDDEIANDYVDVLKEKVDAMDAFSKAFGAKDAMQERLAFIRTACEGGLKGEDGKLDGDKLVGAVKAGSEVMADLAKLAGENKELDEEAKKELKNGMGHSQKSIAKEWMINVKIAKTWIQIVQGAAKGAKGGGLGALKAARSAKAEADKMKARQPIFRELRAMSKQNRELNKQFKTYAESQKIELGDDPTAELEDMPESKDLDQEKKETEKKKEAEKNK